MFFQHVYDKTLAQASYVIGCQKAGVAAVIDPRRDVDVYLEIAKANKLTITHIFETHIHADFLSGSRELAALTGANIYLSDEGGPDWQYAFPHIGLKDGDEVMVGNLKIKVLHTPGHTPEHISFLLTDTPASPEPVMIFTGDFVFVGDVGRPDLLEKAAGQSGTQRVGAEQMYESLKKFAELPDYVQVWPGHGAGSACGKALGAVPSSTVGYEKIRNWAFRMLNDKEAFIDYLLSDQPEPPRYFATMKKLNKVERKLVTEVPKYKKLSDQEFLTAFKSGTPLVDTRPKNEFANGFIPGSINIQNNNALATWAGWYLDYEKPFMLLASEEHLEDIARKLMRIGLDNVLGYISSTEAYTSSGGQLKKVEFVDKEQVKKMLGNGVEIVDLRGASEYKSGHIKNAKHVFVGTLPQNLNLIPKDKTVVIHCQGGDRASIGYSILAGAGFTNVKNYSPGINEWVSSGEELVNE
ncbi:MBL fold metallo-hydrolase [Schleiferia thermophila]|uniref:Hydroxyacylglutathione hydrolase n=1 Tax=Schleiferia thermophila TaxID=884107 RepID=A0A368ZZM0_9FLAO|nr:MBL fold metallo-hydrolase [Schleiferia thermophila]RCX02391.1 hydroxyacylglutathione hydrolase [Schleiferia thermophila]GCD80725.1 MBL fold hydrolase [Schleiferia thermophila]